jgi:hypothetical protein
MDRGRDCGDASPDARRDDDRVSKRYAEEE